MLHKVLAWWRQRDKGVEGSHAKSFSCDLASHNLHIGSLSFWGQIWGQICHHPSLPFSILDQLTNFFLLPLLKSSRGRDSWTKIQTGSVAWEDSGVVQVGSRYLQCNQRSDLPQVTSRRPQIWWIPKFVPKFVPQKIGNLPHPTRSTHCSCFFGFIWE